MNLLRITTVPISIEFKVNQAKMEQIQEPAQLNVRRSPDRGFVIESSPIQIRMSGTETKPAGGEAVPVGTPTATPVEYAKQNRRLTYEVISQSTDDGHMMLDIQIMNDNRPLTTPVPQSVVGSAPTVRPVTDAPSISDWIPPQMRLQFDMDKLNFDWKMNRPDFQFVPGNIEITIKEYPSITIEYIGEPIYFPASADPNYTGPKFSTTI